MKRRIVSVIALMLCVVLAVMSFTACGSKNAVVGSWESNLAAGTRYIFNDGGTGVLDMAGLSMNFTYTVEDGKIEITYEGTTSPQVFEYTVTGSTLSLKDEYGSTITYTKK